MNELPNRSAAEELGLPKSQPAKKYISADEIKEDTSNPRINFARLSGLLSGACKRATEARTGLEDVEARLTKASKAKHLAEQFSKPDLERVQSLSQIVGKLLQQCAEVYEELEQIHQRTAKGAK